MLNKPKFMSPSVNMYGNSVIDLNSDDLPFSCIVDGNEVISKWQIEVSRLSDNVLVFDTGERELSKPFSPVDNRNRSKKFSVNLRDYFSSAQFYYIKADGEYDEDTTYYKLNNGEYEKYQYNLETWDDDVESLYYINFLNSSEPYYWSITLWGKAGTEIHSVSEVFYANSTPISSIYFSYNNEFILDSDGNIDESQLLNDDSSLSYRRVYLKATYEQNEDVPLKCYGWRLTDLDSDKVIFDTISKSQIYGISEDISCICNGLVNGGRYLIELYFETQNGQFVILAQKKFMVKYHVKSIDADFDISVLNNTSSIMMNWGNLKTTEGVVLGDPIQYRVNFPIVSFDENQNPNGSISADIPSNSKIVFEKTANSKEMEVDENSYITLSFQFDKSKDRTLFSIEGFDDKNKIGRTLSYDYKTHSLVYRIIKGDIIAETTSVISDTNVYSDRCWYIVTLNPLKYNGDSSVEASMKVVESIAMNSLFPAGDLLPSTDTYPRFGVWDKIRKE